MSIQECNSNQSQFFCLFNNLEEASAREVEERIISASQLINDAEFQASQKSYYPTVDHTTQQLKSAIDCLNTVYQQKVHTSAEKQSSLHFISAGNAFQSAAQANKKLTINDLRNLPYKSGNLASKLAKVAAVKAAVPNWKAEIYEDHTIKVRGFTLYSIRMVNENGDHVNGKHSATYSYTSDKKGLEAELSQTEKELKDKYLSECDKMVEQLTNPPKPPVLKKQPAKESEKKANTASSSFWETIQKPFKAVANWFRSWFS